MTDVSPSPGRLRVESSSLITPRMLRLVASIEREHLPLDPTCPNLVFRLSPPVDDEHGRTSGARPPSRTYTIRRHEPGANTVDIDVVLHGDGPFVRWAVAAAPGDTIDATGPRPHAVPSFDAAAVVMAADETGLPALASIVEHAPDGLPIVAFVEVADAAEEQRISTEAALKLHWLHRDGAAPGTTGSLEAAVRRLDWPAGRVDVWFAGETTEVRALRRFAMTERGVERSSVHAFGYWRRGRAGSPS